ncbi:hypothetical protein INH39_15395 [Massilia violaceinigra]|uniref:Uncharacterized protein n=1 Tax=Massilia violaceinigra TaxID=2045208 RepID=A0ABY4ADP2_9BURK|nr:hypothetical protein [Massilia violaceinigra]UOD32915.1 hypothetical protein INH39_15395 [Massilia violaceinigra]
MRNFSYWTCFALVVPSHVLGLLISVLYWVGIRVPYSELLGLLSSFSSLIPEMFMFIIPGLVVWLLYLAMLGMVVRRIWLSVARGKRVPASYAGLPQVLGYIGAASFMIGVIAMILSFVLRLGSGVPAAMLMIPAMFCIPWAFFLTEAQDLLWQYRLRKR